MAAMQGGGGLAGAALEAVVQQKKAMRTLIRRRLRAFPPDQRALEDDAIQKRVLAAEWFRKSRILCAYLTCSALREVDTLQIVAEILQERGFEMPKKLFVPRIKDKDSHMSMLQIRNISSDVAPNSMNILEPKALDADLNPRQDVMAASEPVDLFLLPGLAFDRHGRRLGRGGGYYDLFLRNYMHLAKDKGWKPPFLVALAYSVQLFDVPVPVGNTDVAVDALVTSDGVYCFSARAEEELL